MTGRPVQSKSDGERPDVLPGARVRWSLLQQLPLLIGLIVLWMVLWGELTWLSLVSGVVVALVVSLVLYLPPVELGGRLNPFWGIVFLGRFLVDLVVASMQVAWLVIRPRGVTANAVMPAACLASKPTRISAGISKKPGPMPNRPARTEMGTVSSSASR